jgi:hypothetical protein
MKRTFCLVICGLILLLAAEAFGQSQDIYPTLPGTSIRDFSKLGVHIEGDKAYPTLPGTNLRDYSKPGTIRQGDTIYPTLPGTSIRDYSRPGWRIEGDRQAR